MQLREVRPADNTAVRALVCKCLREFAIEADFDGEDRAIGAFGNARDVRTFERVVLLEEEVIACVALHGVTGENATLVGLYVHTNFRHQRISTAMISQIVIVAMKRGFRRFSADVRDDMGAAIYVLEKMGWKRDDNPAPGGRANRRYTLAL